VIFAMSHHSFADCFLAGVLLLFTFALVGSVLWSEVDRRRAQRESRDRKGLDGDKRSLDEALGRPRGRLW
jgi:hypothetical protein